MAGPICQQPDRHSNDVTSVCCTRWAWERREGSAQFSQGAPPPPPWDTTPCRGFERNAGVEAYAVTADGDYWCTDGFEKLGQILADPLAG